MTTYLRNPQKIPVRGMHDRAIGAGERGDLRIGNQAEQFHDSSDVVGR
jgi:hypothetical protein